MTQFVIKGKFSFFLHFIHQFLPVPHLTPPHPPPTATPLIRQCFHVSLPPPLLLHRALVVFWYLIMDDCLCLSVSTLLLKGFKITANSRRTVLISRAGCGLFYSLRGTLHPPPSPSITPFPCSFSTFSLASPPRQGSFALWLNN